MDAHFAAIFRRQISTDLRRRQHLRKLSWILEYLQRPALIHNENEVESLLRKGELSPSPELYD